MNLHMRDTMVFSYLKMLYDNPIGKNAPKMNKKYDFSTTIENCFQVNFPLKTHKTHDQCI